MDGLITSNSFAVLDPPFQAQWKPQTDITAHELALILPIFLNASYYTMSMFNALPENVRRHFELAG